KHHNCTLGRLFQFLDEDGAFFAQIFHYVAVVHNLVTHVDGRSMQLQRTLNDVDGPVYPRAKATRLRQYDFHHRFVISLVRSHYNTPSMDTSSFRSAPDSGWLKSNSAQSSPSSRNTPE